MVRDDLRVQGIAAREGRALGRQRRWPDSRLARRRRDAGRTSRPAATEVHAHGGIEPSPLDAGTAYVAAHALPAGRLQAVPLEDDGLRQDLDAHRRWHPRDAYTRTIREDPVRRGLLYAGTEIGVYVSFNDGARWEPLQLNLPRSSVRDLRVHGNDLIAATHGRAFWVLDDIALLRQLADSVTTRNAYLFQPSPAVRWVSGGGASLTAGQNPRGGAAFDYHLKATPSSAVKLELLDGSGALIRSYSSAAAKTDTLKTRARFDRVSTRAKSMKDSLVLPGCGLDPPDAAGTNRFVWNLRYPGAKETRTH